VQPRVRDAETRLVELGVAVKQQVEIERPRALRRHALAHAAEAALELEQPLEQLAGRQRRLENGDAVEEPRLRRQADRLGVDEGRDRNDLDGGIGAELVERREQRLLAVAEVRAQPDKRALHAASVPLASASPVRRLLLIAVAAALCASGPAAAATGRLAGDPLQGQEWWLHDIGADQAAPPGPGVPITIVDSGVDPTHPEFSDRPNTTFLNSQSVDGPEEWHGTAVASVAAAPENGVGIVGVYPQAALQVWDASPASTISTLSTVTGIETAAQHCPGVINLSFGSTQPSTQLRAAILDAFRNGCLVVASAGNDGANGHPDFPAAYAHVLTVAASDQNDTVPSFSSEGPWVDVAAPGVGLVAAVPLSHNPAGYSTGLDGTSFSAPIVSAAAAWVWTMRPTLDVTQIFELMRRSARDIGAPGFDPESGWGIVNIPNALAAPAPPRDPDEPNDDIDEVQPGRLFPAGQPTLTTAARPSNRIAATLDASEDPGDIYRIWVPAHHVVRVSVSSGGNAAARIWGPQTTSVDESLAARRRDLKGQLVRAGNTGFAAYAEVLLTGRSIETQYVLSVKSSIR